MTELNRFDEAIKRIGKYMGIYGTYKQTLLWSIARKEFESETKKTFEAAWVRSMSSQEWEEGYAEWLEEEKVKQK